MGRPGSKVTLVDTGYKGTVQELLQATYPHTQFTGKYMAFAASPHDPHPDAKKGYALHLDAARSFGGRPVSRLPDDVRLTFAHQDAIGSIEETLHGPASSPKRIGASGPVQAPQRLDSAPLAGLNPIRVTGGFRDPVTREGCKDANLIAVSDYARQVAKIRGRSGDWRGELSHARSEYRTEVRAWIQGTPRDAGFGQLMDSFVRRADKAEINQLAAAIRRSGLSEQQARPVWRDYNHLRSLDDRRRFVTEFNRRHRG